MKFSSEVTTVVKDRRPRVNKHSSPPNEYYRRRGLRLFANKLQTSLRVMDQVGRDKPVSVSTCN